MRRIALHKFFASANEEISIIANWRLCVVVAVFSMSGTVFAADFCVGTVQELTNALTTIATGPAQTYNVHLVEGTYVTDADFVNFTGALTVQGGYDAACVHHTPGAARTILQPLSEQAFPPSFHAQGALSISDLTLDGHTGAFMWPLSNIYAIDVARVAVFQKEGSQGDALQMSPQGGTKSLEDVLVDASTTQCALDMGVDSGNKISLDFLTVVNRGSGRALCVEAPGKDIAVNDSIAVAPNSTDVFVSAGTAVINSSVFATTGGAGNIDPSSSKNLASVAFNPSTAPWDRDQLADSNDQTSRDSASPIAGIDVDILGNPRTQGDAPDRGAFELAPATQGGFQINPGITGNWFDPDQSGHGFSIEILDNNLLLAQWYVFTPEGGPTWIEGVGPYTANSAAVPAYQVIGAGGRFPPNFNPQEVQNVFWGTLTFTFADCNHGNVSWTPTVAGYTSGSIPISRLTIPKGLSCP